MLEKVLILDVGSQYTQLIARRVRELNVYCEIHPYNHLPEMDDSFTGVIISGSPHSVREADHPTIPLEYFGDIPVLGVCYGAQFIAQLKGGDVQASKTREYGRAIIGKKSSTNPLVKNLPENSQVWMSHADTIKSVPDDFEIIASTETVEVAAYHIKNTNIYGIQFHPEVTHSIDGKQLLHDFLIGICGCKQDWTPLSFIESTIEELKETVKDDKVVLGLSGGVDSTVAACLLQKAIGENLYCIFVNNGLLRKDEYDSVLDSYKDMGLNVKGVDATDLFMDALKGISDPEGKRKAIGKAFIDVFDIESNKLENVKWLGQGTIYPDVIESISVKGPSATIKSHHNVGGLPAYMKLKVVEPLKLLFKDEVRRVGTAMGINPDILGRHPFPGPGLGIRILGDITPEKVNVLQLADSYFINGLKEWGLYDRVWQAGVMLLPIKSVGVMGDERTYENVVALRAVESVDGMTADWCDLPHKFLAKVSNDIINNVKGVNRVVYDISSKPPATIEWE
jgi:GMP synthase (glutamine-hydrolysing)